MTVLRLYLLGRTLLEGDRAVVDPGDFAGRQGAVTLTFLADVGHRVDREALADVLWLGSPPEGWDGALSAIVSKVRKALHAAGVDGRAALPGLHGCYELRLPTGIWVDLRAAVEALDAAEAAVGRGEGRVAWPSASVATSILARPLLAGETGVWLEQRRRELLALRLRALEAMARAWMLIDNPAAAVTAARAAVDLAPLRESSHALLISALKASGDRAEAIGLFHQLQRSLRDELGITPGADVQAAYLDVLGHG